MITTITGNFFSGKALLTMVMFVLLLVPFIAFSQGNIKMEAVDIVKTYQPLLADADKIDFQAQPASQDTAIKKLTYEVKDHLIEVPYTPAEMRVVSLPVDSSQPLQNNLLKAGFGTQLTPLLDLQLHNGRSDKLSYGLEVNHLSSNASKIAFQDFSKTGISLFGTSYVGGTSLSAATGFQQHIIHYYGIGASDSTSMSKSDLKKVYTTLPVDLVFRNTRSNKGNFDYRFDFHYHHFSGDPNPFFLLKEEEDFFDFNVDLHKEIEKIHSANLLFRVQSEHSKLKTLSDSTQSIISFVPYYQLEHKLGKVTAGVDVSIYNKTVTAFPHLEAEYKLIGEYLIPYLGWMGGWNMNTYKDLSEVNPFIGNSVTMPSKMNEAFLGLKGSYGNNISYNLKVGYEMRTNQPFFLPDSLGRNYFSVFYYYKTNIIHFHAEVGYRESDRINLVLSGDANSYNLDYTDQPWGIPKSRLNFALNYNLQNKIFTELNLYAQTGAYTILPGDTAHVQLKGRVDANVKFTYNYKKNVAAWLSLNNIFAATNSEWYNYPTYGFQVMAGVNLKF